MTVYSTRFAIATWEGPDPLPIYTVPEGTVIVVRSADIHDPHGGAIASFGTVENPSLIGVTFVPGSEEFHGHWTGYQVFNAGDVLAWSANNNDTEIILSGYLLYTL